MAAARHLNWDRCKHLFHTLSPQRMRRQGPHLPQLRRGVDMTEHPFFVYGTLRPDCGNDRLYRGIATVHHDGQAFLSEHRLTTAGPFPYCIPAPAAPGEVPHVTHGALVRPEPGCYREVLDRLDMLEGYPVHYDRRLVEVDCPEGVVSAWVYIPADEDRKSRLPAVHGNDWAHRPMPTRWDDVDDDESDDDFDYDSVPYFDRPVSS